jgi:4a-hydroxytetrahydrobiopterin dehydratase
MCLFSSHDHIHIICVFCIILLMELDKMKCVPCQGGVPTLTDSEIAQLHPQVSLWSVVKRENDGIKLLQRSFDFKDFAEALAFTNKVGELAEKEGHHPDILTQWGKVTVMWWTHKINGLHQNDFVMAAKTDGLYNSLQPNSHKP